MVVIGGLRTGRSNSGSGGSGGSGCSDWSAGGAAIGVARGAAVGIAGGIGGTAGGGVGAVAEGKVKAVGTTRWGVSCWGGAGGIVTMAVGCPDRSSRVWFNLFCSTLVASGSANSLMVATISLFVH